MSETADLLSQRVYEHIRGAIIRGMIRPNGRLVETDLANELQVSRTPVREALRRLHSEGLVLSRRREWVVRDYERSDIEEIYELRMGLELLATRLAARKASERNLEEIVRIAFSQPLDRFADVSLDEWIETNRQFHDSIAVAAHNLRLQDALRRNNEHYFNYRLARLYSVDELIESFSEHTTIANALQERKSEQASLIMEQHLTKALEVLLRALP